MKNRTLTLFATLLVAPPALYADNFDDLDANKDGVLTRDEFITVAPPAAARSGRPSFRTSEGHEAYAAVRRQANLKIFRDAFDQGKLLSVRLRLERAAIVTGELMALAEKVSDEKTAERMVSSGYPTRTPIYPRVSHLVRLMGERPWIRDQLGNIHSTALLRVDSEEFRWPTEKDQPELRRLVFDKDPDIRAMAIEALATLQDPGDLKLIAQVGPNALAGTAPTVGFLSEQHPVWANGWPNEWGGEQDEDPLCFDLIWRQATVDEHVERALRQMTGADVTCATFAKWVARHGDTRDSLWSWQQRLQQQFDFAELSAHRLAQSNPEEQYRLVAIKHAELRKAARAELAALDRQVEAKVLLLAKNKGYGTHDLDDFHTRFFDSPWQTRLTKGELFNLLEGGQPWSDVDWADSKGRSGEIHTQLVTRIMLNAEQAFAREDVPRLQKLLDDPKPDIGWYGRAASIIGISRLLPAAAPKTLDDPGTREGYLRKAIREESEVLTNGYVARELVRIGLPGNVPFLRATFYVEKDNRGATHDVRSSIIEALGQHPLTDEKRKFLFELITDPRCRHLLARSPKAIGDDWLQTVVVRSINSHAGRQLVSPSDHSLLHEDDKASEALDRILENVQKFERDRTKAR